eukprot:5142920-Pleurochrysis_carterae.AAC.2
MFAVHVSAARQERAVSPAVRLQVGHEVSDTVWSFSRDGTVSWLHGLRFLPGNAPQRSIEIIHVQTAPWRMFLPVRARPANPSP